MRRKLLTILVIGALAIFASAPAAWCGVEKGDKEIGGVFSIDHNTMDQTWDEAETDQTINNFGIGIDGFFGYMLTDKFEIALDLALEYDSSDYKANWSKDSDIWYSSSETSLSFIPGLSLRYLFGSSRLRPFLGLGVLAYTESYSYEDDDSGNNTSSTDNSISGWGVSLPAGIKYFVSERTALNIGYTLRWISYTRDMTQEWDDWSGSGDNDDTADGTNFSGIFNIGFSIFL